MTALQQRKPLDDEYCVVEDRIAFVLAVDELGAFIRAKQLIEEQTNA